MKVRLKWAAPAVLVIALAAFFASLAVGTHLFPHLTADNDDAVYVLEAKTFAHGDLTLSDSLHGDAFRPWMSGRVEGDRLVLVEQPLLPALMAVSYDVFGSMRPAVALVAAAAVIVMFLFTRELIGDDRVALVAAVCFACSPLVIVQSAMFVSYLLAITLAAATLLLLTIALDRRDSGGSPWWFVGAGTVHGVLLVARPLEGIVLVLIDLFWILTRRPGVRTLARIVGLMALGAIVPFALGLLYNELTTGHPFLFPLWTIGGDDSFGFGPRSIAEHARYIQVGPSQAWLAMRTNLRAFPHWLFGGIVSVAVVAWGAFTLWRRGRRREVALLATMIAAYPAAYFFYYGNYLIMSGRNFYGPHYYLALLIPSVVLLGVGIVDVFQRRAVIGAVVVAVLLLSTAIEVPDKVHANERIRDDIAREVAAVDQSVQEPAVVIIPDGVDGPYVLHPRGALSNPPDLDAPTLFAADLGGRNLELFSRFAERNIYRFQIVASADGPVPDVRRLERVEGDEVAVTVTPDANQATQRVSYVQIGEQRIDCDPAPADAVSVQIGASGARIRGCTPAETDLEVAPGPGTVTAGLAEAGGITTEVRWWTDVGDTTQVIDPPEFWRQSPDTGAFVVVEPNADTSTVPIDNTAP